MASSGGKSNSSQPKEALVIQAVLKDMGVTDYEPAVVNQLLDFTYRYVTDILDDAKAFSTHANKKAIDVEDTKLAVQLKLDKHFTTPPPRELLLDIAQHKNNQTLPLIKPYTGPKLPADRYCLSAANYKLRPNKKPPARLQLSTGHSYTVPMSRVHHMPPQKTSLLSGQTAMLRPANPTSQSNTLNISHASTSDVQSGVVPPQKRKFSQDDDYDT